MAAQGAHHSHVMIRSPQFWGVRCRGICAGTRSFDRTEQAHSARTTRADPSPPKHRSRATGNDGLGSSPERDVARLAISDGARCGLGDAQGR